MPQIELDIVKGDGPMDFYLAAALVFGPGEAFILDVTPPLVIQSRDDLELFTETWQDRAAQLHVPFVDRRETAN